MWCHGVKGATIGSPFLLENGYGDVPEACEQGSLGAAVSV